MSAPFARAASSGAGGFPAPAIIDQRSTPQWEALQQAVGRIQRQADDQVSRKSEVERRWLTDLRQYHGKYEPQVEAALRSRKNRSQLFVNQTRSKVNAWEARLSDMLYPTTDDKNWGVKPTPVPELMMASAAGGAGDQAGDAARQQMEDANRRADGMERTIEDQLRECQYGIRSRQSIHDAVKLGTGVMKGPVISRSKRRRWAMSAQQQGGGQPESERRGVLARIGQQANGEQPTEASTMWSLGAAANVKKPEFVRVDPWAWFPDMAGRREGESNFDYERHFLTERQVRELQYMEGFDHEALRRILRAKPIEVAPSYMSEVASITGQSHLALGDRYIAWEFHGSLTIDEVAAIALSMRREDILEDMEPDPLDEYRVVAWICNNELLAMNDFPMDSGESLFSAFNFEQDDASRFGFGVPYLMRDTQSALNGAWRMMMDNGALSTGPQVVIDKTQVEPQDGSWEMSALKVWLRTAPGVPGGSPAFEAFATPSTQAPLAGIIQLAKEFIDDEINLPVVAQGDASSHITKTANGLAILMNSANVVFRRVVRNFDDEMTVPNIRRIYDWNMQFNPNEAIKGDFDVDARGSSVMLVRDMQAQNLMAMLMNFSAHPLLGPMTKTPALYRKLVQSFLISADDVVKTDEELKAEGEAAAKQPKPPDPKMEEITVRAQMSQNDNETKLKIAAMERDTQMMVLAAQGNMSLQEIQATLADKERDRQHKERAQAAEMGAQASPAYQGSGGGGYV